MEVSCVVVVAAIWDAPAEGYVFQMADAAQWRKGCGGSRREFGR